MPDLPNSNHETASKAEDAAAENSAGENIGTEQSASSPPAIPTQRPPPPMVSGHPANRRLSNSNALVRLFVVSYFSLAVMAAALFFLPWSSTEFRSGSTVEQSGIQMALGQVDYERISGGRILDKAEALFLRNRRKAEGFIGVWFHLGGLLLVIVAGLLHVVIAGPYRPLLPMLGSGMAAAVVILMFIVPSPLERQIELTGARTMSFIVVAVITFACMALTIAHYTLAVIRQRIDA